MNKTTKKGKHKADQKKLDETTQLQAEAAEYLEGWQRAKAELDNFKKQSTVERAAERERIIADTIVPLLALADTFGAMAQHVPDELADNAWAQGVVHVAKQLESVLSDYGVTKMTIAQQTFDPQLHEAIEQLADTDAAPNTVVEVVQAGYLLGERVLRPAKVKVAK